MNPPDKFRGKAVAMYLCPLSLIVLKRYLLICFIVMLAFLYNELYCSFREVATRNVTFEVVFYYLS